MLKKTISIIVTILLFVSVLAGAGCKKETVKDDTIVLSTVHGGKATKTDKYIYKDGKTDYVIVIPDSPSSNESKAGAVLASYFGEATGHKPQVVKASEVSGNAGLKAISVGNNAISKKAGVKYSHEGTSDSGFDIRTVSDSIYLVGGKYGVLYAAYELLERLLGFDYYGEFCYSLDKDVSDISLYDYDIKELPDIETRMPYASGILFRPVDPNIVDAMRLNRSGIMTGYGATLHNSLLYVPYSEYGDSNPNWFTSATDRNLQPYQLCYTRDTDGLVNAAWVRLKEHIITNPDKSVFTFVCEDNMKWCNCSKCRAMKEKYGCDSASYIIFLNKLTEKACNFAKTELKRDIALCGLAYYATEAPPAKYDKKTESYVPIDENVRLHPNLYIEYAPHGTCDYYVSFDGEGNENEYKTLCSWSALTSRMFMYVYNQADYQDHLVFYDNFSSMQRNYRLMVKNKTAYILDLGTYNSQNSTAFNGLRAYLSSKLAWNANCDYSALIDKYFENYFKAAKEPMREIFDAMRNRYAVLHAQGVISSKFYDYASEKVYPKGFLKGLLNLIDEAKAKIEYLKNDNPDEYSVVLDRITLESISFRYLLLEVYPNDFETTKDYENAALTLKADCTRLRVTRRKESVEIDELWRELGVA